jgi:predicted nucleic-acid-binding Zn-ribbon protein
VGKLSRPFQAIGGNMRNGICPKCGSQNIYTNTEIGPVSNVYGVQAIPVRGALKTEFALLVTYVCAVCGYSEIYVQGSHSIAQITKHWKKVEAQS